MNRQQRRAAARQSVPFFRCSREKLAEAAMRADQAQQPGVAALMREVMRGDLALVSITDRAATIDLDEVRQKCRPTVLVVGDDDHASTGPAGWKCADAVAGWAASAVIHGAGATADTYIEAVAGARVTGACALIETDAAHATEWTRRFAGKPTLLILPRNGAHPVETGTRH